MRRVALLTTAFILVMVSAGCRDDGRTLREAKPDQNQSISTLAPPTDPVVDPANTDAPESTAPTTAATIPPSDAPYVLTAPWAEGGAIDAQYTCDGANTSPALTWSAAPEGTLEIAVTMTDLDLPTFAHWAIAGLDPTSTGLAEGEVPLGAVQATNGVGDIAYTGPCPPAGSTHTYEVTVHYLGERTGLGDGAGRDEFSSGISTAEIASTNVTGTFSRG
ncbi:MAG: YbhB/YbcL family Raf kinase inhibitor-like protein [Actinobacteria bacterium]|nr:YbhB/YbcL family Raf kinase inhibitor-like protein [Actinomycetota bacterium]